MVRLRTLALGMTLAVPGVLTLGACELSSTPQSTDLALAAPSTPPPPPTPLATVSRPDGADISHYPRVMGTTEVAACESKGGSVQRRGLADLQICVKPYADAGKICTDSVQCQGRCIIVTDFPAEGEMVEGSCQTDNALFGCYAEIRDGHATDALCID